MQSRIKYAASFAVALALVAAASQAEVDRVGTLVGAIWCNDGQGPGSTDPVVDVSICQAAPAEPGPEACPDSVDKVLLEFSTENPLARGRVRLTVNRLDSAGNVLSSFRGSGRIRQLRADVEVLLFESLDPGDWLQAVIELPGSARRLHRNECAIGSLAVTG